VRLLSRYFALIIRAISVLEGIALVGNEEFAIIDEAYPYLAQRLLTDDSPRLRESLKYMVYGKSGVFDAERLIDLLSAFETFTVNSRSATGNLEQATQLPLPLPPAAPPMLQFPFPLPPPFGGDAAHRGGLVGALVQQTAALSPFIQLSERMLSGSFAGASGQQGEAPMAASWQTVGGDPMNTGSRAALLFLLSEEGAFFRTFLMDELVCTIDALSRDQVSQLVRRLNLSDVMLPVFLPGSKRTSVALAPEVSEADRRQVDSVAKLVEFFAGDSAKKLVSGEGVGVLPLLPRVAQQILPEVSMRLMSRIAARFIRTFYV
jgi:aarF domain-containing kinase